ncbi:MAG: hypothetical protein WAZ28_06525 [Microbacterium sp.]
MTSGAMDRAVDSASTAHPMVRGVYDSVDPLLGDVALNGGEGDHSPSLPQGLRPDARYAGWLSRRESAPALVHHADTLEGLCDLGVLHRCGLIRHCGG